MNIQELSVGLRNTRNQIKFNTSFIDTFNISVMIIVLVVIRQMKSSSYKWL